MADIEKIKKRASFNIKKNMFLSTLCMMLMALSLFLDIYLFVLQIPIYYLYVGIFIAILAIPYVIFYVLVQIKTNKIEELKGNKIKWSAGAIVGLICNVIIHLILFVFFYFGLLILEIISFVTKSNMVKFLEAGYTEEDLNEYVRQKEIEKLAKSIKEEMEENKEQNEVNDEKAD